MPPLPILLRSASLERLFVGVLITVAALPIVPSSPPDAILVQDTPSVIWPLIGGIVPAFFGLSLESPITEIETASTTGRFRPRALRLAVAVGVALLIAVVVGIVAPSLVPAGPLVQLRTVLLVGGVALIAAATLPAAFAALPGVFVLALPFLVGASDRPPVWEVPAREAADVASWIIASGVFAAGVVSYFLARPRRDATDADAVT